METPNHSCGSREGSAPYFLTFVLGLVVTAFGVFGTGCGNKATEDPQADTTVSGDLGATSDSGTVADSGDLCKNGVIDDGEGDVDCGTACASTCALGAGCKLDSDCGSDAICTSFYQMDMDSNLHCRLRVASCDGSACGNPALCLGVHHGGVEDVMYYCWPELKAGGPCFETGDKDLEACPSGYRCLSDPKDSDVKACEPLDTNAGATCDINSDTCIEGYACTVGNFEDPATCEVIPALGEACHNSGACGKGLYCDMSGAPGEATCQPRPGVGEACTSSIACPHETLCKDGTCTPIE